jgi:hypothetical protein
LVFSHIHNSFDKKKLLEHPNPTVKLSDKTVDDFVKEPEIKNFFLNTIDHLLNNYEPGNPEFKPDVLKQMEIIQKERIDKLALHQQQLDFKKKTNQVKEQEKKLSEQSILIQELMMENNLLKNKVKYFEDKFRKMIEERVNQSKKLI